MFDFNYNEPVGFVSYTVMMKAEAEKATEAIDELSGIVDEQGDAVVKNSAAIADNKTAIDSNKTAIEDEGVVRESADNELNEKIESLPKFKIEVVDELPETGDTSTIYLLKVSDEEGNMYKEYVYSDGAWEELGPMFDLSGYVTKEELEEAINGFYTKDEIDELVSRFADKSDVDAALELKADAENVYTKEEADDKFLTEHQDLSNYATKSEVEEGLDAKADADNVYTKEEADEIFLTEHQDISNLATKAEVASSVAAETAARVSAISDINSEIDGLRSDISLIPKFKIEVVDELGVSGESATVYLVRTGDEAGNVFTEYIFVDGEWEMLGTQKLDLTGYATETYVDEAVAGVDEKIDQEVATINDTLGTIETNITGLADKNLEQDAAIAEINSGITELDEAKAGKDEVSALLLAKENEIYNLTKIVGDIGGAVTYDLPNPAGKSFNTLMGNNGTVKLIDDVTTGRFGPGITAKNTVVLNLNSHDLTITGLTSASTTSAIMARGSQTVTIGGKGTVDAGEGICIMANGADATINLSGSTTVYRTDRSGGELIYCFAGTINITNGTFRNDGETQTYTLNCYDANYRSGTAKIIVSSTSKTSGPKFYDFNPADNSAEGEHTSFVAEGCEVVVSTVVEGGVEHTVYTVVKSE